MKIDPLPPIPSPPQHHWRQFRVNALPFIAFGLVLFATIWLWGWNLSNPLVMGQAEAPVADVTTYKAGRIARLNVVLYQEVKVGDVIATVETVNPEVLSNKLAVIRAEMEVIRTEGGLNGGDQMRYSQFQLQFLLLRVDLALKQLALPTAETNFWRDSELYKDKIISEQLYDFSKLGIETLRQSIADTTKSLDAAEQALRKLDPAQRVEDSPSVRTALAVAEEKLRLAEAELQPIKLLAPISGRISKVDKISGASVSVGDAIASIASPTPDRIVGYLGQPLRIEPKLGMKANVRSRGLSRVSGGATITQIGPRIELFNAPLRIRGMGAAQERGLPIIFTVPPNMKLRPGELVDISLEIIR